MSGKDTELVYWDSGLFIALLTEEDREDPSDLEALKEQAKLFDDGKLKLATSVITRIEVLEYQLPQAARDAFALFFQRRNAQMVEVDRNIADIAHNIRNFYAQHSDHYPVAIPDAIHLATAILSKCDRLYTFDGADLKRPDKKRKSRPLLQLSGVVGGRYPLIIEKPRPSIFDLPMFKGGK